MRATYGQFGNAIVMILLTNVFSVAEAQNFEQGKLTGNIGDRDAEDCQDVPLFINFDHNPDGTSNKPGTLVGPDFKFQGGSHFGARDKADNDELYDDGILMKNGGTTLQLVAGLKIPTRQGFNRIPRTSRSAAEFVANFDYPVITHSIIVLDPDNDPEGYKNYNDYGHIELYARKGLAARIDLPPNNVTGLVVQDPPPKIYLGNKIAAMIDLGDLTDIVKIVVDMGDGGWKAIDRLKITAPCEMQFEHDNSQVVIGSPFSRLSNEHRQYMIQKAKGEGDAFEFPECVGESVEKCQELIAMKCPECMAKGMGPKKFNFYRIWIFCDEDGKVVKVPRRG